jgi:hypothetical protein
MRPANSMRSRMRTRRHGLTIPRAARLAIRGCTDPVSVYSPMLTLVPEAELLRNDCSVAAAVRLVL